MYKIACNWSEELFSLIQSKQVNIDYIKTGAYGEFETQIKLMRTLKPILLHGLGYFECTGMKNINIIDFQRANKIIKECCSPHYGLHLAIKNSDISCYTNDEEIHTLMSERIQIFKKSLSVPLLLENTPDSPQDRTVFNHYPYAEPEKISRLLNENDVNLLLDLTHAKITAQYRNWNIYDFLNELPLQRIKEIHVNGSGYDEQGFPADTHQTMSSEDYKLLEWVLEHSNPDIITLEYNGTKFENKDMIYNNLHYQLNTICSYTK